MSVDKACTVIVVTQKELDEIRLSTSDDAKELRAVERALVEHGKEIGRLRDVIRTGGAAYRAERAVLGVAGGEDPEREPYKGCFRCSATNPDILETRDDLRHGKVVTCRGLADCQVRQRHNEDP